MSDYLTYLSNITVPMIYGMIITLSIFGVTIACSIPLGFLFTLMAQSKIKPIKTFANGYIYVLRGKPLLL